MSTLERAAIRQRLAGPLATGGVVVAAFALVGLIDPHQPGRYPVCPTLSLLGFYCPMCGGLRAANDLTQGDVAGAASSNALFVLLLPVAIVAWILWVRDRARGSMREMISPTTRQVWAGAVVLLVFMVLRNQPFGAFLAP